MNEDIVQLALKAGTDAEAWKELFEESREHTTAGPHQVNLVEIGDDRIVLAMPIGDHCRQPFGLLHGGVSMMLAESAASLHSCWGVDLTKKVPVGIEINGSHLNSAREGRVEARGAVIRRGETLIHHRVEIVHVETGRALTEARVTNFYKHLTEG